MSDHKFVGHDYATPDLIAKVTGRAKYAEDMRADGMLFCKLLLSPMPHARVRHIDASQALRIPGVHAILTADELPVPPNITPLLRGDRLVGEHGRESTAVTADVGRPELGLTNEPMYEGEPILAVAAVDEVTAANAIERIIVDLEPLPFCVDPLESLRPDGPNARLEGNVNIKERIETLKWTREDWSEVQAGRLPFRDAPDGWAYGDLEAGFRHAAFVLDETLVHQSTSHAPLEPRTSMAYWQNEKVYIHGSTQSIVKIAQSIALFVGVDASQVVYISEYCGGGFGGKNAPGSSTACMAIPALLAKKTGRPVMMRIGLEEEHSIGRARAGLHMRARVGFRKDGRITAMDLFIVQDNGPYDRWGDAASCASTASCCYTPLSMRYRGTVVYTNTPPRASQRAPGGLQSMMMIEPLITRAARELRIDQVDIHKINAPITGTEYGARNAQGNRARLTSAFAKEALDQGASLFGWSDRKTHSGRRRGSKVRGVGVALSSWSAGDIGYDGLVIIRPDGKVYIHQGIGNLGTGSVFDTARIVADVLDTPWETCNVLWGDTRKHLPWSARQGGSRTTHAHSRCNYAAALDLKRKLTEIAAKTLGGTSHDYEVANERVFHKNDRAHYLTFAVAASMAQKFGGEYDGHVLPADIHPVTKESATALAGFGVMGIARDNYGRSGNTQSFVAGFAEVEVDVETGAYEVIDYAAVADVGTVLHPRNLAGQVHGGAVQGIGHVRSQNWAYDQQYGVALAKRFITTKPPTILDVPFAAQMQCGTVDTPDPQTPVGAKGVGESSIGAGAAAVRNALEDALGYGYLRRTPVTLDNILNSLEAGTPVDAGLTTRR